MKGVILNPEAITDKGKLFTKDGKTTLKNLAYINSGRYVQQLMNDIDLLLPSELLKWISNEDIEKYYYESIVSKHEKVLSWMKEKHIYKDTGEVVKKDDYFVEFFFGYNKKARQLLINLKNYKFKPPELDAFIKIIECDEDLILLNNQ